MKGVNSYNLIISRRTTNKITIVKLITIIRDMIEINIHKLEWKSDKLDINILSNIINEF